VALFNWRLEKLNTTGKTMAYTAHQLTAAAKANADHIQQIEHSLKRMEIKINTIDNKLKGK
jgi:hypothetical protein